MRTLSFLTLLFSATTLAAATDVLTVGNVTAPKGTILVPVHVRDVSSTRLGVDRPGGQRIQALGFKVTFAPAGLITNATFTRAGALLKTPLYEKSVVPVAGSSIGYVAAFAEANNALAFTSNAAAPGTLIGYLSLTTSASVAAGNVITLTVDPATAMLSNQTASTTETFANNGLSVQNGSITIAAGSCDALQAVNASINGPAGACTLGTGGTANAAVSGGGAVNYQWGYRLTPGGSITAIASATSSSYTISGPDFDGTGTKYLVVTATPSCGGIMVSNELPITIGTTPNVSINASSGVYANDTENFASVQDQGAGTTYNWTIGNGTITSGQGTSAIKYTAGATGSVTLDVTVTKSGCGSPATPNATVPIISRPAGATMLYLITPCRLIDTRDSTPSTSGSTRNVLVGGFCGVPAGAKAIAANVTVIGPPAEGWLSLFPSDAPWPGTSSLNYRINKTRASNGIFRLSGDGRVNVLNQGTTVHFIVDVTGYFK